MTKTVNECLRELTRQLQHDMYPQHLRPLLYNQDRKDSDTISCNFRLDAAAVEYLKFNGYNLTTCIKHSLTITPNIELPEL